MAFETDCLKDIASFIDAKMSERRRNLTINLENIIINNWAMYNSSCLDCECRYLCKGLCLFSFQKISENHCKLVRIFYKNAINNIYNKYGMDPFLKYNYIMDKIECSNF